MSTEAPEAAVRRAEAEDPALRTRLRRLVTWRRVVSMAAVGLVGVAIATALVWRSSPHAFSAYNRDRTVGIKPTPIGTPVFYGMTFGTDGDDQSVAIETAEPRVVRNSAGSTFEVLVCTTRSVSEGGIGVIRRDVSEFCSTLESAAGKTLQLGQSAQQLILSVTPTRAGVTTVAGIDLTYTDGRQHGTQRIGLRAMLTTGKQR